MFYILQVRRPNLIFIAPNFQFMFYFLKFFIEIYSSQARCLRFILLACLFGHSDWFLLLFFHSEDFSIIHRGCLHIIYDPPKGFKLLNLVSSTYFEEDPFIIFVSWILIMIFAISKFCCSLFMIELESQSPFRLR